MMDKNAYGPFSDGKPGTRTSLSLERPDPDKAPVAARISYTLGPGGYCGYWMRAGDLWGGQDWTGAKRLTLRVRCREPLEIEFGFNDANQNAYIARFPRAKGKGWETLSLPFGAFGLNRYYQPPGARAGLPLDLSHVETFNIAPVTPGDHEFELGEVAIER
jgi:hypothetical protein